MPATKTGEPRTKTIGIRLRDRELEVVEQAATVWGCTISELARTAILDRASRVLNPWMDGPPGDPK